MSAEQLIAFADTEDAIRAVVRDEASAPMLRQHLPSRPGAGLIARQLVRRICEGTPAEDLADDAELVVTELVANATMHGSPPLSLTVTRGTWYLHIAVRDANPAEPRLGGGHVDDGRDGGRGLLVVDALCVAWGCTPTAQGKVVWATLGARSFLG
jgi:anti-sigma regulatory factor (Ser/Thr protein kinase)